MLYFQLLPRDIQLLLSSYVEDEYNGVILLNSIFINTGSEITKKLRVVSWKSIRDDNKYVRAIGAMMLLFLYPVCLFLLFYFYCKNLYLKYKSKKLKQTLLKQR